MYLFAYLHESLFSTFPSELYAWSTRLVDNVTFSPRLRPTEWTLEAIQRLE